MKKNSFIGIVLAATLLVVGMALTSCAEFDAFSDGYQYGKSLSFDSGSIFDKNIASPSTGF